MEVQIVFDVFLAPLRGLAYKLQQFHFLPYDEEPQKVALLNEHLVFLSPCGQDL